MAKREMPCLLAAACVLAAAGGALLSGCGGAAGPTWSGTGPMYGPGGSRRAEAGRSAMVPLASGTVRGIVEVPASPRGARPPVAWMERLRLVSPAQAEAQVARSPLAQARVCLIDRATRETVSSTVTTDARGEFRIDQVTPSPRFSVLATDGQVTLEAVLPDAAGRQEVRVAVNEATTVGAAAARLAEAEGLTPEAGVQLAGYVAGLQENREAEQAAGVPDLSKPQDAEARARQHLLNVADAALAQALDSGERAEVWRALAAAQVAARTRLKLPNKVRLTPLQGEAVVRAVVGKETRTVTREQILAALRKAGVKDKEGKSVSADHLASALESLRKTFPALKDVQADRVPVLAALLLAEQGDGPFRLTTRDHLKVFLKELVGEVQEPKPPKGQGQQTAARGGSPKPASPQPPAPGSAAEESHSASAGDE